MRGLKFIRQYHPHPAATRSHPSWVRGLKFLPILYQLYIIPVAPFMGAWIEIGHEPPGRCLGEVAPFMGAWIEINATVKKLQLAFMSHPSWVRGLKY